MDLGKLGSAGKATAENEAERLLKAGADADIIVAGEAAEAEPYCGDV